MNSTLESKTIRPGSLGSYSYYHSQRRPAAPPPRPAYITGSRAKLIPKPKTFLLGLVLTVVIGVPMFLSYSGSASKQSGTPKSSSAAIALQPSAPAAAPAAIAALKPASGSTACSGNTLDKLIVVSISQRHLWACQDAKSVYNSAVITGMLAQASTLTPPGTYHIYSKTTNTTLSGSDETGSWSDPVYYWMPFLNNEHGSYGFHDATWRPDTAFGKIDPHSAQASHGCVELPLATAKWLYNWAPIDTTVTVES